MKSNFILTLQINSIFFALWHDRSVVRLMSKINMTEIVIQKITQKNPLLALEYIRYAKGVDLSNQLNTTYRFPHKSKKWWKPIIYYILQVTITTVTSHFLASRTPTQSP